MFCDATVEPLSKRIDDVQRFGQELIKPAGDEVSTVQLVNDCKHVLEKWNRFEDILSDHKRSLDQALVTASKFSKNLDGLFKWLTKIEESLELQEPLSAEYKHLITQLQKQKLFKKSVVAKNTSISVD